MQPVQLDVALTAENQMQRQLPSCTAGAKQDQPHQLLQDTTAVAPASLMLPAGNTAAILAS